jgi:hypothetical protein
MSVFDAVEILAEFSKSIRHALIALEGLHSIDGVDQGRVSALTDALRRDYSDTADYLAFVIGAASLRETKKAAMSE